MAKILCVTGMHRSGTSLVASWVNRCGLVLDNGSLMGSSIGNPKGHFEDEDFVDLHSLAITKKYPKSKGWIVTSDTPIFFNKDSTTYAKEILNYRSKKSSLWGWKDPRTVLFLEQWKMLIPDLKAFLIWRPCADVVTSLLKRYNIAKNETDKISLYESVRLWKYYNSCLCGYKKNHPDDTVLFNLYDVITYDSEILDMMNIRFNVNLLNHTIRDAYEESMLCKNTNLLIQLICKLYRFDLLDNRLRDLSEL